MTVAVEAVLPLGAASQVPGYEYFTGGTCFLARRKGRLFVVTARHALQDKPADEVWVPHHADTLDPLPLRSISQTAHLKTESAFAADIAAFAVDEKRVGALAPQIDFDAVAFWNPADARSGAEIVFAGFPKRGLANAVDYVARTVSRQRFIANEVDRLSHTGGFVTANGPSTPLVSRRALRLATLSDSLPGERRFELGHSRVERGCVAVGHPVGADL